MPTHQAAQSVATLATKIEHMDKLLKEIHDEIRRLEQTFEQLMSKMAA